MRTVSCATRARRLAACLAVALAAVLGGCGDEGDDALVVFVGGTMRPALEELARQFQAETGQAVAIDYAGSGELLARIEQGQRADCYICHDPFLDILFNKGLGREGWTVAAVTPVIVVPKGNPKGIGGLPDLARPGVDVVLTDYNYSTLGHMVEAMFTNAGVDFEQLKADNVRTTFKSGGQAATSVGIGRYDAALVWNAVAHLRQDKVDVVPLAPEHLPQPEVDAVTSASGKTWDISTIRVTVATLASSERPEAARRFAAFVASDRGRTVFERYGFTLLPARKEY